MRMACLMIVLLGLVNANAFGQPPEKPRTRATAEDKQTNLSRYVIGGFGQNATASLGVKVVYSEDPPLVTVSQFLTDSPAEAAGLEVFDWIIEVDGSPVGKIRGRFYELWQKYGRSGQQRTELLVAYNTPTGRKFYYPKVATQAVEAEAVYAERDGFTIAKPRNREDAENANIQLSRYTVHPENFDKYSPYELGADVTYSYGRGATIASIKSGSAAASAGLKVGDMILEVDGAPIGVFGNRTYEVWQQYKYSKDGRIELLIAFDRPNGAVGYFYPQATLTPRQTNN